MCGCIMVEITLGKFRALSRASHEGVFGILALDHQDALRRAMHQDNPESVTDEELTTFKLDVVKELSPAFTGVLHDPVWGASQAIAAHLAHAGLLVELEKADYGLSPLPLNVEIRPDWSVANIKRMGADGVKLFFYYLPEPSKHRDYQESIVAQAVADCKTHDIPLYAEPIRYPLTHESISSINYLTDTTRIVVESARQIGALGADILKLEFPVSVEHSGDEGVWIAACQQITAAIQIPWTLLSAGVDFDTFARQVACACKGGASGFIVGRAVWGEACILEGDKRHRWLRSVARPRMEQLLEIAYREAVPWTHYLQPEPVDTTWHSRYTE